jgi:hypothetical protein
MKFPTAYLAVAVGGALGAYTTFSTFEYETIRLIEEGRIIHAVLNVVLSVVVGFFAIWGGIALARKFENVPVTSHKLYDEFERLADLRDPHQSTGAERDIRDASIRSKKSRTAGD